MQNKNNMLVGLVVVLVVVAGLVFVKMRGAEDYDPIDSNGYSVVYLSTGEVYVGHLSTHRDFELKDSYILQVAKNVADPTKNDFQLQPISEALWAPQSLHINKKNVVFYGSILPTSKIGQALAAKKN